MKQSMQDKLIIAAILSDAQHGGSEYKSAAGLVDAHHFDTDDAQRVWPAIAEIAKKEGTLTAAVLVAELTAKGLYAEDGSGVVGPDDIYAWYTVASDIASLERVLETKEEVALREERKRIISSMNKSLISGNEDDFWTLMTGLRQTYRSKADIDADVILDKAYQQIEENEQAKNEMRIGIPALEKYMGRHYLKTDIYTIFGHPGHGKTTVAINLVERVLPQEGRQFRVLYITIEESATRIQMRRMSMRTGIPLRDMIFGGIGKKMDDLLAQRPGLYADNFMITDTCFSFPEIYKMIMSVRPDLVVIDHLHMIRLPSGENKDALIGTVMSGLKEIAKFENCSIILLAQTRKTENRAIHPSIDDLYYSKSIEHVSSYAISCLWPAKAVGSTNGVNEYSLEIQKARYGETATIDLQINPNTLWIDDSPIAEDYASNQTGDEYF